MDKVMQVFQLWDEHFEDPQSIQLPEFVVIMDFIRRAQFDSEIIESLRSAFFTLLDPSKFTEPAKSKLNPMEQQFVNLMRGRKGIALILDSVEDDSSTVLSSVDAAPPRVIAVDAGDYDQKVSLLKKHHAAEITTLKVQLEKSQEQKFKELQKKHEFEIASLKSKLQLLEELLQNGNVSQASSNNRNGVPARRAVSTARIPSGTPRAGNLSPQRGAFAVGTPLP
jgi:hypothetical protein